jgi:hypothetical protein
VKRNNFASENADRKFAKKQDASFPLWDKIQKLRTKSLIQISAANFFSLQNSFNTPRPNFQRDIT